MTQPNAEPQTETAPPGDEFAQLKAKHAVDWHLWKSGDGLLYATRRAQLLGLELDESLGERRPWRTLHAERPKDLDRLIKEQHELVAEVTGDENPLSRGRLED